MTMVEKNADRIAACLERMGIRHAFGIIGAGNSNLFDAIHRRGFTQIICVHHEQAACMAVQTYYRLSGRLAVALVTTGGGSTNAVTGVMSAWMDSIPSLIISGNEASRHTRPDNPLRIWGVQGYDSVHMVEKCTKLARRVLGTDDMEAVLEDACSLALSGRPGPVWLDIPMDVQAAPALARSVAKPPARTPAARSLADAAALEPAIERAEAMIRAAKRPVFWLGHGIRLAGASHLLEALLDAARIPSLISWAGIDMIDSAHPLVYGRAGVYGQRCANFVLQNADLVVAIGTRLALPQIGYSLDEFARAAELVVVDIDPAEVAKLGSRVALPIVSDAGAFMAGLLERFGQNPLAAPGEWIDICDEYRRAYPWLGPEHADQPPYINSYAFMERLNSHLKADEVIVTDMGTALLSGHQMLRLKPGQRLMTSTGLGEMGYGLPAAIGASFARNRGEVLCLNCDGGMMMNLQELQTVVHHKLPIKLVIFNNDGYLMIKHTQRNLHKGNFVGVDVDSGVSCPDFSALAGAFGIPAHQIRSWEDFDRVWPLVQAEPGPVICEVFMHPMQYFHPKLSVAPRQDGTYVSPPLEDLSPLLPREELARAMIIGLHPKSREIST